MEQTERGEGVHTTNDLAPENWTSYNVRKREKRLTKELKEMARKNYTVEQIIVKLREVELHCNQGKTITEACRGLGITEQTYYRWRKEYGGMNTRDARRMKDLEKENARLKKLVAEQALDISILRDVNSKNF